MMFSRRIFLFFQFMAIWVIYFSFNFFLEDVSSQACYDESGRAQACASNFEDITKYAKIHSTSNCGERGPEDLCWLTLNANDGKKRQHCQVCDSRSRMKEHPVEYLVDRHMSSQPTCWISGRMDLIPPSTVTSKLTILPQAERVVNITLSFGKTFEVYYVSLEPCNMLPDAIAVYKSLDHGITWQPWQFFASDCQAVFGMQTIHNDNELEKILAQNRKQSEGKGGNKGKNDFESLSYSSQKPVCLALREYGEALTSGRLNDVIAFSTTLGRYSPRQYDPEIIQWMTMTDIRLSFIRLPSAKNSGGSFTDPRIPKHIAFSYLQIGGKCFCHGHGNECAPTKVGSSQGPLQCRCQHHTTGQDCERCADNYLARSWASATPYNANECLPCDCNGHSVLCTSTREKNGKAESRCIDCQHNTRGNRCHECADGYFRDPLMNITDPAMCKTCICHPIGAQSLTVCDRHTGQCLCKQGVTGIRCDRCKPGYQQTNSVANPCQLGIQDNLTAYARRVKCDPCKNHQRIRFKKFCRKDAVFQAQVVGVESYNSHHRISMKVMRLWRNTPSLDYLFKQTDGILEAWITENDYFCECPKIKLDSVYLIIAKSKYETVGGIKRLLLNPFDTILPWNDAWNRRLDGFEKDASLGKCSRFNARSRFRKAYRSQNADEGFYQGQQYNKFYDPYQNNNQQEYGFYNGQQ